MKDHDRVFLWASTSIAFLLLTAGLEFYFHSDFRRESGGPSELREDQAGPRRDRSFGPSSLSSSEGAEAADDHGESDTTYQDALSGPPPKPAPRAGRSTFPTAPTAYSRSAPSASASSNGFSKTKTGNRTPAKFWNTVRADRDGDWERDDEEAIEEAPRDRPRILAVNHAAKRVPAPVSGGSASRKTAARKSEHVAEASRRTKPPATIQTALKKSAKPPAPHQPAPKRPASWVEALGGKLHPSRTAKIRGMVQSVDWDGQQKEVPKEKTKTRLVKHSKEDRHPFLSHQRSGRPRRPSLKELLGDGLLRPPTISRPAPDFEQAQKSAVPIPPAAETAPSAMSPKEVERMRPPPLEPQYAQWKRADAGKHQGQWHAAGSDQYWHEGPLWGIDRDGRWSWMIQSNGNWWAWNEGRPPLLWHANHWWWQSSGTWFLLHEGEAWSYRSFPDWALDGLVQPNTGTRILYSADGTKAAIVGPGNGATLVDIASDRVLSRWDDRLGGDGNIPAD